MSKPLDSTDFVLEPVNQRQLASLCGQFDQHIRQIERRLGVEINNRGNSFRVLGGQQAVHAAERVLKELYREAANSDISASTVNLFLQSSSLSSEQSPEAKHPKKSISLPKGMVTPRGNNQAQYVQAILNNDINFGIGPAGTGKTYLAVACAANGLLQDRVSRIQLVRPAVEAGERLGFLPGDLAQKVDPYLRPLYDALYDMLGFDQVAKLLEKQVIEVAPLAYMRGRTLNDSFVILDEAQNTTREQMKMFLTRIGFGSTAVITGDITQIDLQKGEQSGLKHAIEVLGQVSGITFTHFKAEDVVRHPLIQRIIEAYERQAQTSGE
ncbi:MAG TPA: PhoH family protein [Gammaproteobacteria bacterium]|nr:PhoH family protein [Gammaproteobacteria bacterium]